MADLPLGPELDWTPAGRPPRRALRGPHVVVRPVDADVDAQPLFELTHPPGGDPSIWTYLWDGPYESAAALHEMLARAETSEDPLMFTLASPEGRRCTLASRPIRPTCASSPRSA